MRRSVVFIHGAGVQESVGSANGLAAYLREALERYDVRCPRMPAPERPTYASWRDSVALALGEAGDEPYLVGHSLGASVLVKYLSEEYAGRRVGGLFLIAAPYWGSGEWEAAEYALPPEYVDRLDPNLPVFVYHSRDDEVVPVSHGERYAREIATARLRVLDGRGHEFRSGVPELVADVRTLERLQ